VILTANTETQLRSKSWPEVTKWVQRGINKHWFKLTATSLYSVDPSHERLWRADAIPWSEENTEAFAGLHNEGRRLMLVFDESSSIADQIWEVAEGALTDANTEIIWLVFGNPTRSQGRFRECFGRFRHRWDTGNIDSREVEGTNVALAEQWIHDYGEDSDFVRVRVRGLFPQAGSLQFIGDDLVREAASKDRKVAHVREAPLVMGVDVARFGDDPSVIAFRSGRDARTLPSIKLRNVDTMQLSARVAEEATRHRVDTIFVDGGGVGGGVVDRLRQIGLRNVLEIQFQGKSDYALPNQDRAIGFANKRAEMWGSMREWLKGGAISTDDLELHTDLTAVEYGYVLRDGQERIILEKKEEMRRRGLASPDNADALAITFAYPVLGPAISERHRKAHYRADYDPYRYTAEERRIGERDSFR
jgi:hypothetical protein